MSTDSTTALEAALRTRLLTFEPLNGDGPVVDALGSTPTGAGSEGNLYWDRAPDNLDREMAAVTPGLLRWGVLRLKNRRASDENAEREMAELEVMLYARPRSQKATLEGIADRMDQAMRRYRDASSGFLGCVGKTRNTLPPLRAPADSDVVQIMLDYTLVLWPAYLTQYHDSV